MGLDITVIDVFDNCSPVLNKTGEKKLFSNSSGIKSLHRIKPELEGGNNIPGIMFEINQKDADNSKLLLFGKDGSATIIMVNSKNINFVLRKKQYILPIHIKLKDFAVKKYPNSEIVKSYESIVEIRDKKGMIRDVKISMNKPLRYDDLTFFQSSYYIAPDGAEYSIFSVVKNSGRLLPYVSSLFIFVGLIIHFIMMLYRRRKKIGGEAS